MDKTDKLLLKVAGISFILAGVLLVFTYIPVIFFTNSVFMYVCLALTLGALAVAVLAGAIYGIRRLVKL
jgi:hypothetical protein